MRQYPRLPSATTSDDWDDNGSLIYHPVLPGERERQLVDASRRSSAVRLAVSGMLLMLLTLMLKATADGRHQGGRRPRGPLAAVVGCADAQ